MLRTIIGSFATVSIMHGIYVETNVATDRLNNELIDAERRMNEAKKRYEERDFGGSNDYYRQYKSELLQDIKYEENRYKKFKKDSDSAFLPVFIGCANGVLYPIKKILNLFY